MPDHQIVIKLDKKRFNEAQRLAKEAGYRSATSFLRERVVSLLDNPEGEVGSSESVLKAIHQLDSEILKMQQEMQVFISEAEENYENFGADDYEFPETENLTIFSDSEGATFEEELPADFDTTSNIITEHSKTQTTDTTSDTTNKDEKEKNVWRAPTRDFSPEEEEYDEDVDQIVDQNIGKAAEEQQEEIPAQTAQDVDPGQAAEIGKASTPDMEEVLSAVDEANDELEEMADRAFSISPRLGSFDEAQSALPITEDDPLAELLDDTLLEVMKTGEQAPLESRIVQHQLMEEPAAENLKTEETEPETETESEPVADPESEPDSEPEHIPESNSATDTEGDPESEEEEPSQDQETAANSAQALQETDSDDTEDEDDVERHDLSSGPPPKRRK